MTQRILSGIQSSGQPTMGNYLGAFLQHMKLQETYVATFMVADLHSITVRQDPKELHENSYAIAAWYLAAGLDPQKSTIFLQSHVSAHAELGWILSTFTQMGELERMTQFKDKSQRNKKNINAGLFTYPTLQAADILLHHPHFVPVGHDQVQHLELTRNIAVRFNGVYGDVFTVPEVMVPKAAARVKDLQEPTRKMSKSLTGQGTIFLEDDMKVIEKKIKRAVTDDLAEVNYDMENQPGVSNLVEIYSAFKGCSIEDALKDLQGLQYGGLKGKVAETAIETLEPLQQRYQEFMADKGELNRILQEGAQRSAERANKTLEEVQKHVGFVLKSEL